MRLHVGLKCACLAEVPLTEIALVWFLARVNHFVLLKLFHSLKPLPADFAHERGLARVSLQVFFEVARVIKGLVAVRTGVGLFLGIVSFRMVPKFAGQVEGLLAHDTSVTLGRLVLPHVHSIVLAEFELLGTDFTGKGSFAGMRQFVCLQSPRILKGLLTEVTREAADGCRTITGLIIGLLFLLNGCRYDLFVVFGKCTGRFLLVVHDN